MIPIEDLTDVTLAIDDTEEDDEDDKEDLADEWWKLSSDESYQVMKIIKWWKLSLKKVI